MSTLDHIIDGILLREGGAKFTNRKNDRGGPTKYGITQKTLSEWRGRPVSIDDVKQLTEIEARDIYRQVFCIRPGLVKLTNFDVMELAIDCAVNHGPMNAVRMVQQAARVYVDGIFGPRTEFAANVMKPAALYRRLCAVRVRFYGSIIANDHTQAENANGWFDRVAKFIERQVI